MSTLKIKIKLIKLLEKVSKKKIKKNLVDLDFNYFDEGFIDSLNFIKFVFDIEEYYNITFNQKDLLSKNFKKIEKLSTIIHKKITK